MTEMLNKEDCKWVDAIWQKIDAKMSPISVQAYGKIPYTTIDGVLDDHSEGAGIARWTNGFWPGYMWLLYAGTKKDCYRKAAEKAEEQLDAALTDTEALHHDVGFMWRISSGVNYQLTGNEESRKRTYLAAQILAARLYPEGGFIRAWNQEEAKGYMIIDTMMNLPLLYWATETYGDLRYSQIAQIHADTTIRTHLRKDGSVYHTVDLDVETGEVKGYIQGGGASPEGAWSRGQGWAIYGFVLSYIHTGEKAYIEAAKKTARYFIEEVKKTGYIPKSDFYETKEKFDTSAGALAACGMIEIARNVPDEEKEYYLSAAINILKALEEKYCNWTMEEQSILQNCTVGFRSTESQPLIYGDYYFTEAIYKLKGFEPLFW